MGDVPWTVYLIECRDGTYYCGVCLLSRLEARIEEHNSGKGARYTASRWPVKLLIATPGMSKQDAYRTEYRVKRLKRQEKKDHLAGFCDAKSRSVCTK